MAYPPRTIGTLVFLDKAREDFEVVSYLTVQEDRRRDGRIKFNSHLKTLPKQPKNIKISQNHVYMNVKQENLLWFKINKTMTKDSKPVFFLVTLGASPSLKSASRTGRSR